MKTRYASFLLSVAIVLATVRVLSGQDLVTLHSTVQQFLSLWYVQKNFEKLLPYIATDNAFADKGIRQEMKFTPTESWTGIFKQAFRNPSQHLELKDAIEYPAEFKEENVKILNAEPVQDRFAIIDPESSGASQYLPPTKVSGPQRERFDARAKYLDHLRRDYKGRFYIVVYNTENPTLLREIAVLYWIAEAGEWKLAAFQGTE
jgi:hypothetical protein